MGCVTTLTVTSTMSAAPRLLADVLVMDGTTFSTPAPGFVDSAIKDFVAPILGGSYTGVPVTTPEQIVGINQSAYTGLSALQQAMAQQEQRAPGQPYVIFGYSQSAVIVDLEKIALAKQKAAGQPVPDVTFVVIGDGERPNGGIAERFSGLTIPFFDFTFNGAQPTNAGIPTIDIARQYDGLADTPEYPINLLADANALLGVIFEHALYGEQVSLDPSSPNYVAGTTEQQHGDTTYYFIPTTTLPLLEPLHLLGIPQSVLNIIQPVLSVLVEAGYDRATPFGVPEPAQLIPSTDPVSLAIELTGAVLQGTQNAASLIGLTLPGYPQLSGLLSKAQTQVAGTIADPYRQLVSALNTINPIVAFDHIEGAVANVVDRVINATGIPRLLNKVLGATVLRLTAWAERTLLFPQHTTASAASTAAASSTAPVERTTTQKHAPRIPLLDQPARRPPPRRASTRRPYHTAPQRIRPQNDWHVAPTMIIRTP